MEMKLIKEIETLNNLKAVVSDYENALRENIMNALRNHIMNNCNRVGGMNCRIMEIKPTIVSFDCGIYIARYFILYEDCGNIVLCESNIKYIGLKSISLDDLIKITQVII